MDNKRALDKVVEAIKNSNNVLVTINRNPNVDQIAAAIALSFVLEKLEKFTTTIFSGPIPAAAEFLDPEKTFSSNMETLRDFVISIDKDKVDRLRYKQEGDHVRVYLTPYKTTISQNDLQFENGDYNIDLVITIGTVTQEDMDNAIVGAIRILHDATVVAINTGGTVPSYATISWSDPEEVAYCEMVADLAEILGENEINEHTATSLLTGIVAATDQFKNIKANPKVMQLAAKLMSFGANQQLISIKLEEGMKIDQQNAAQAQAAPETQADNLEQVAQNMSQNLEATTNAVNIINTDQARNKAEDQIEQIAATEQIQHDLNPTPEQPQPQPPVQPLASEPPAPDQPLQLDHPQPVPSASWPPKLEDMQHGRDYFDYYNNGGNGQNTGQPPVSPQPNLGPTAEPSQQPVEQPSPPAPEPDLTQAAPAPAPESPAPAFIPEPTPMLEPTPPPPAPAPAAENVGNMPIPPMPPMPPGPGNVMEDLASYAPPAMPEPTLPSTEPTPGFFSPSTGSEQLPAPMPTPVPSSPTDITSRNFMSSNPSLDSTGGIPPSPGDQAAPADTANTAAPAPELADLSNIAAQAASEELSSDSGRASFDVGQELGSNQSQNPFLASSTPSVVSDPAAQLQQQPDVLPPQAPGDVPNTQFKIPGQ